jgi:hypothetical protein
MSGFEEAPRHADFIAELTTRQKALCKTRTFAARLNAGALAGL